MKTPESRKEGLNLKQLRIDRTGLSQDHFAESVGVKSMVIQNLEQGYTRCRNLAYYKLKAIANGLLETPETLLQLISL